MNVGSIVKYYRTKNSLTQSQLADGICSISHLSKIESNAYSPHESTIKALLMKMGVQLNKEVEKHKQLERMIGKFIDCSLHYDLETMRKIYQLLELENDYIQSTDLVNQYELYKFRFYIYDNDLLKAGQQKKLLERMKASFLAPEHWVYQFFQSLYCSMMGDNTKSLEVLNGLDLGIQSIPQKFEGEFYYQKARMLILADRYEFSGHFAELAVRSFQLHHNYIRLLHAQMLLAINYTRRNLLVQAESLYEVLIRNTHLTKQTALHNQTLYNYTELLRMKNAHGEALEILQVLKESMEEDTYFYKAVLTSLLESMVETGQNASVLIDELKAISGKLEDKYFHIYANYFEKRNFSQPDLMAYCEEIMFPFFRKHGYIKETKRTAAELAAHYSNQQQWKEAYFYQTYSDENGGESK
ncbi:transcriptional regulator with XRE-family HTH domain [Planomicrobium stackebrandtii]|uniref:Transcriptional regulator with XRE-family HTH domain n=1 Tax=Planomicrobium stackebrandtii TaxID=253160 RepID=A0ABU0GTT5_9BACL|nr:helix-turn-helix transcriptional regulator [Planomicrobium stackebrandtii]MDQ0428776.1 transcriptional regulator with XRE-family HTH domain [Planomicrobium stackebrandtii]